MKTITILILAIILYAGNRLNAEPKFDLKIEDITISSSNTAEFSIKLYNTGEEQLYYSLGQYFLTFNDGVIDGDNYNYSLISSDLPEAFRPRNPSLSGNLLKLACNSISGDKSILPSISPGKKGLTIARMRLESKVGRFTGVAPDLNWASEGSMITKVVFFRNNVNEVVPFAGPRQIEVDNIGLLSFEGTIPEAYDLKQNFPNPFNPETKIRFSIPEEGQVSLKVFDVSGRLISTLADNRMNPGTYEVTFRAHQIASGMYFYRLEANGFSKTSKMVLLK